MNAAAPGSDIEIYDEDIWFALDRSNIHVEVPALTYDELVQKQPGRKSETMWQDVDTARELQQKYTYPSNVSGSIQTKVKYCAREVH